MSALGEPLLPFLGVMELRTLCPFPMGPSLPGTAEPVPTKFPEFQPCRGTP